MPCKTHRFRFLTLATALALAPFAFLAAVPANAQSGTLHAAPGQGLIRLKSANWCCHVWTAPILQGLMSCWIDRMGCGHVSGLLARCMDRWP